MSRGLKVLCGLLVVVLVLAGAAVGVSRYVAMRTVQSRVAGQLGVDPSTVHASTSQWVLLSVFTSGTLDDLSLDIDRAPVTVQGSDLSLQSVHGDFTDLSHVQSADELTAGTLEASAVMSWDDVSTASGMSVSGGTGGTIQAETTVEVLGAEVPVTVTAVPTVAPGGAITLTDAQVSVATVDLPDTLVQAVLANTQDRLVLPDLPGGLGYSGLEATADGIEVAVSGQDVRLSTLF